MAHAINWLRDEIVSGRIMPGERLIEADLAEVLGTNRANVRIALYVLETEGLVSREPNRGARVRPIPEAEAVEIAEARIALESLVARKAAEAATPSDAAELLAIVERMRNALDTDEVAALSALHAEFHGRIRQMAGSQTLSRLIVSLRHRIVRVQYRTMVMPGRPEVSLREHSAIAQAIAARDPVAAEMAMRDHLTSVLANLKKSFTVMKGLAM
jgi:DNA-binding GntR family transcriptional regulator